MWPIVKLFFFLGGGGLNKLSAGETKMEEDGGMGGEVKWGKEMFDREGGIGRDSRGHGLKESDRHRRGKKKKQADGGCLEGVLSFFFFFLFFGWMQD